MYKKRPRNCIFFWCAAAEIWLDDDYGIYVAQVTFVAVVAMNGISAAFYYIYARGFPLSHFLLSL
jgi:hypothetical protein